MALTRSLLAEMRIPAIYPKHKALNYKIANFSGLLRGVYTAIDYFLIVITWPGISFAENGLQALKIMNGTLRGSYIVTSYIITVRAFRQFGELEILD